MKVLSVSLQKGGVGKSTITANLAVGMSKIIGERERILVVDMDHQGNLTYQMLGNPSDVEKTAIELFTPGEKYKATDIVHNTRFKNIEIIPSNLALSKAELYTSQIIDAHNRLAQYLKQVVFMYDYVSLRYLLQDIPAYRNYAPKAIEEILLNLGGAEKQRQKLNGSNQWLVTLPYSYLEAYLNSGEENE